MNTEQYKYQDSLTNAFLEQLLGRDQKPTKRQFKFIRDTLFKVPVMKQLFFDNQLTTNEAICLYWAALGKSSKTTAELMKQKVITIESYRKEIKRKLRCSTIAEAVNRGMRYGYVPPNEVIHKSYIDC